MIAEVAGEFSRIYDSEPQIIALQHITFEVYFAASTSFIIYYIPNGNRVLHINYSTRNNPEK